MTRGETLIYPPPPHIAPPHRFSNQTGGEGGSQTFMKFGLRLHCFISAAKKLEEKLALLGLGLGDKHNRAGKMHVFVAGLCQGWSYELSLHQSVLVVWLSCLP